MAKERNHTFDFLCGICIVRMIGLHIMQICGISTADWWVEVMRWCYFFMAFFFFKAGYFNKTMEGNTGYFIKDKTKRLLLPYLVWGLIGNAVYFGLMPFVIARYHNPVDEFTYSHLWETSCFYGNVPCWFLFSFFSTYVLIHFIEKVKHLHWIILSFPLVSYVLDQHGNPLWMNLNNVFMGTWFFFLGHIWHWLLLRLRRRNTFALSVVLTVLFMITNVTFHGEYTMMRNAFEGHPFFSVLSTMLALCGLSGICLSTHLPRVPVVNYIGQHSMVYFVSHMPLLLFYRLVHLAYGHSIWHRADDAIVLVPFVFVTCTWLVPFVESKPWLSGRFKKKA